MSFNFLRFIYLIVLCVQVVCLYVCRVHHVCACGGHRGALDSLDIQTFVNHGVSAGTQTQVFHS